MLTGSGSSYKEAMNVYPDEEAVVYGRIVIGSSRRL